MSNLDRVFEAMKQAGMMDFPDPQQAQHGAIAHSLQSQDMPISPEEWERSKRLDTDRTNYLDGEVIE